MNLRILDSTSKKSGSDIGHLPPLLDNTTLKHGHKRIFLPVDDLMNFLLDLVVPLALLLRIVDILNYRMGTYLLLVFVNVSDISLS